MKSENIDWVANKMVSANQTGSDHLGYANREPPYAPGFNEAMNRGMQMQSSRNVAVARDLLARRRVEVLRTRPEIETLRQFWGSCSPPRDADFDFFLFIVDLFPEVERVHVVVLYEEDVPKALLAGRIEVGRLPIRLGYFAIPVPKLRILQIVHGGWLGAISEENAKALIESVVDSLAAGEADVASLHSPDFDSSIVRCSRVLPSWWCSDHAVRPQARRVRELSGAAGPFSCSLSQNERYQQRKRARNLTKGFAEHRIDRFTGPADVDRLMRDAELVASKSYQRGLRVGFSGSATIRSRLQFEANMGWLQGYILYLDGQPAAFWIGSLRNGVFLSEYLSFDPGYTKYGPGIYLVLKVMEDLHDDPRHPPTRLVDFGIGDAAYKERLATRHWHESSVLIFAPRLGAVWVNALRSSVEIANRSVKQALRLTPWLLLLKRRWRTKVIKDG
ncbi:GNAT family N-acetyltransferase [Bradyrhizobium canariense]|uniref:GNAT family N-acetyltransferase n=1 Tax=Bradyrhizobium canariense TaxID=255045 RepID=UPI001C6659C1|nr:GNAT family N-acetyltransferase [Bradyrhizobium canariense]MBW5438021.1 GNAT family N-acetyltransferase [Bradyrhizobium canariense]